MPLDLSYYIVKCIKEHEASLYIYSELLLMLSGVHGKGVCYHLRLVVMQLVCKALCSEDLPLSENFYSFTIDCCKELTVVIRRRPPMSSPSQDQNSGILQWSRPTKSLE